ncbi:MULTISPECIES: adenosylmethionine decarboxylase [Mycolicibacter]|uniref:S-adenosylmethionine decarboxylase proenzyme n=2 Tax=Mycolicibacter TaxID=1073531 RepID=A0ABU5XLE0_9MYCO|nr:MULTISPECIES: adenosylmethionine decarboxylase [unclassified Mycolicibacter]MEB3022993.1 adenosylmethionine decarboxylase [Mycolicibacter sp. MYC098]MEB3033503.1 adenosylmethionine decarboxylase [Mycolicibacter sp. MYC340]
MSAAGPEAVTDCPLAAPADCHLSVDENGNYAGKHLLVDLFGASGLDKAELVESVLRECAETAGATVLHSYTHSFAPSGGVSAVVVLAESHVSIHSWPELRYAAIDIYMCGSVDPHAGIASLKRAFQPDKISVTEIRRGQGEL